MSYDYEKKQQTQAKTKISLEKWEKKVLKPFKTIFFFQKILFMILWTSSLKEDVAINIRMT